MQTTDATFEKVADAKGFNKKSQGISANATATDPKTPAPRTISTSQ